MNSANIISPHIMRGYKRNRWGVDVFFILLPGNVFLLEMLVIDIVKTWTKVKSIPECRGSRVFDRSSRGKKKAIEYSRVGSDKSRRHSKALLCLDWAKLWIQMTCVTSHLSFIQSESGDIKQPRRVNSIER